MEEIHFEQAAETVLPDIALAAREYVLAVFNGKREARLVFHNYQFTVELVERVAEISHGNGEDEETMELALLGAWFLNTGYLANYPECNRYSQVEARKFFSAQQYPQAKAAKVLQCIHTVSNAETARSPEERVLADAYHVCAHIDDFFNRSPLLRLEQEFLLGRPLSKMEWAQLQLQQLLQVQLSTHYAKAKYEPLLAQNILRQKGIIEKKGTLPSRENEGEERQLRKFQKLEPDLPGRATQTFFRSNYRNHINLSAIADNKANIMISVNSILISVLITFLSYRNIAETNPIVLLPVVIFLVTGLSSLVFAVLSARPKVTTINKGNTNSEKIKKNIVFFGNFVTLELEEYEEAMDAMFRDSELLYGNMTRDLYFLGKVLDKKYRYLSVSYNIFMLGLIATVGTFLFALFT